MSRVCQYNVIGEIGGISVKRLCRGSGPSEGFCRLLPLSQLQVELGADDKMPPCPNCNNTTFTKA